MATSSSGPWPAPAGFMLVSHAAELAPFRIVLLPVPDINIVCYVVSHPSLDSLGVAECV